MQLPELQLAMRSALLGDVVAPCLTELIASDEISADERLAIYRSTIEGTLIKALKLNYPAVERLLGGDYFSHCAATYARLHPPISAYLNDYGVGFAEHLQLDVHAARLPYVIDVARLEWAVSRALNADNAAPLDLAALARLDPLQQQALRFLPHPSLTLLRLETPADAIWKAVLAGDDLAISQLDPTGPAVWLLIERVDCALVVCRPSPEHWQFLNTLCSGAALNAALAAYAGADAQEQLALHLAAGRLCGWRVAHATDADAQPTPIVVP